MKRKMRLFLSGFVITVILMATLSGFAVIDISTEYYMPGSIEPLFQLNQVGDSGIGLTFMGKTYSLEAAPLKTLEGYLCRVTHLLPPEAVWMAKLSQEGFYQIQEDLRLWRYGEDPE